MPKEAPAVSFDEFSSNLRRFFERVIASHETVIVEDESGERAILKPVRVRASKTKRRSTPRSKADHEAFLSSFGSWSDVDVDKFIQANYESRSTSSRPPVEL